MSTECRQLPCGTKYGNVSEEFSNTCCDRMEFVGRIEGDAIRNNAWLHHETELVCSTSTVVKFTLDPKDLRVSVMSAPSTRNPPIHPFNCAQSELANQLSATGLVIGLLRDWPSGSDQQLDMTAIFLSGWRQKTCDCSLLQISHMTSARTHCLTVPVTVSNRIPQATLTMWMAPLWSRSLIWSETSTRSFI